MDVKIIIIVLLMIVILYFLIQHINTNSTPIEEPCECSGIIAVIESSLLTNFMDMRTWWIITLLNARKLGHNIDIKNEPMNTAINSFREKVNGTWPKTKAEALIVIQKIKDYAPIFINASKITDTPGIKYINEDPVSKYLYNWYLQIIKFYLEQVTMSPPVRGLCGGKINNNHVNDASCSGDETCDFIYRK